MGLFKTIGGVTSPMLQTTVPNYYYKVNGKKGHYVFDPNNKKYFMTSDGKLHTGQIDDL